MKIAREIVETAERRHGCAPYERANVITATGKEWEEIIAAKLAPVREALQVLMHCAEAESKCESFGIAISKMGVIDSALHLLSDEDTDGLKGE